MKVSKVVLGIVIAGILLIGSQKGSKAEEGTEVSKEAPAVAVPALVVEAPASEVTPAPAHATETVPVSEVTPAPADATEAAPASEVIPASAHATETVPASEVTPAPADATEAAPAPEVTAPVVVPAHTEKKEEISQTIALSVAELFAKKAEFNGKNVTIVGKVAKVNLGVMGRNWIHVQDGTGTQGTNDITVTTSGQAKANDKVSVSGTVATDKDFGGGYKYSVIIEEATIKVQ